MRFNCLQENFSHGLGVVQRAVATRTTLPITQHVLMSTDEGRLKLSATNLEIGISTWVGAEIEEEGAITVPARLLTDFVNSLSRQTISVNTMSPGKGIELKGEHVSATISGADADEFPPIPSVSDGVSTKVAAKALREAIHQVVLAAAVEDSRPVLTGVNMDLEGTKLVLAAADGFRLAVHTTEMLSPVDEKLSVIVPRPHARGGRAPERRRRSHRDDGDSPEEPSALPSSERRDSLAAHSGLLPGTTASWCPRTIRPGWSLILASSSAPRALRRSSPRTAAASSAFRWRLATAPAGGSRFRRARKR